MLPNNIKSYWMIQFCSEGIQNYIAFGQSSGLNLVPLLCYSVTAMVEWVQQKVLLFDQKPS